jgi:hypothetical protein
MPRRLILAFPFALAMVAGCGAREPQAVPAQSPLDDRLSCLHLQGEHAANRARLLELTAEAERRGRDSIGMVLAGGIAGALFIDPGETQRAEAAALERRNERLRELGAARGCALPGG